MNLSHCNSRQLANFTHNSTRRYQHSSISQVWSKMRRQECMGSFTHFTNWLSKSSKHSVPWTDIQRGVLFYLASTFLILFIAISFTKFKIETSSFVNLHGHVTSNYRSLFLHWGPQKLEIFFGPAKIVPETESRPKSRVIIHLRFLPILASGRGHNHQNHRICLYVYLWLTFYWLLDHFSLLLD